MLVEKPAENKYHVDIYGVKVAQISKNWVGISNKIQSVVTRFIYKTLFLIRINRENNQQVSGTNRIMNVY